jgi:hypothetical protein
MFIINNWNIYYMLNKTENIVTNIVVYSALT